MLVVCARFALYRISLKLPFKEVASVQQIVFEIETLSGAQPEIFQGRRGFVELGQLNKLFIKNTKKGSAGKNFGAFSPRHS